MPVTTLTLAALAAVLLAPAFTHADARVILKHAYQLERAPAVAAMSRDYSAQAGAYVLYEQCGEALSIPEQEREYVKHKFTSTARAYQIAYQDAYVSYVGASPKQAMVDDIAARIKAQQQTAVNGMASAVRRDGCESSRFYRIRKYIDELRAKDNAPPPDSSQLEPKATFSKKR